MFSHLSSLARSGVIALTALSSVPASAAPLGPIVTPAVADSTANRIILAQGEGRDRSNPAYQFWRRGGRNWDGDGRRWRRGDWNGDGRRWRRGDWDGRRHYRGYRRGWYGGGWGGWGPGIALGFGIPLGYGLYNNYYDEPIYRPRYRAYGGGTHVEWCYNRYRSYRAWDNTFQPYYGPRRQCLSPYS
jgi:hypothetical protein